MPDDENTVVYFIYSPQCSRTGRGGDLRYFYPFCKLHGSLLAFFLLGKIGRIEFRFSYVRTTRNVIRSDDILFYSWGRRSGSVLIRDVDRYENKRLSGGFVYVKPFRRDCGEFIENHFGIVWDVRRAQNCTLNLSLFLMIDHY